MSNTVTVVGGGLAGTEAAWQLAQRGVQVRLFEMRPTRPTPAHVTDRLAELVCSNSMGSTLPDRALGILKNEMLTLGSFVVRTAFKHALPAGQALAVGRDEFAEEITARISGHPHIELVRREVTDVPVGPTILATGPLTSDCLTQAVQSLTGRYLYFYDAMAPIVTYESIDRAIAFRRNRWDKSGSAGTDEGDYFNCPLDQDQYEAFVDALLAAPRIELSGADKELERYFEGCMPIEALAQRGKDALAYGPMRPVGLRNPNTGQRPHAVVQLRQDNVAGTLYNLVGFQTNVKWGAQAEILRMIPGLKHAEFVRLGQMHRNTFINSPTLLRATLQFKQRDDLFFAGQITGTEGYVGSALGGLLAGINVARMLDGQSLMQLPRASMSGALFHYITNAAAADFQPMKANMGLLPPLPQPVRNKRQRYTAYADRAKQALDSYLCKMNFSPLN